MTDDGSYVIRTGAAARDRLELIARLFWPSTEPFLRRNGAFEAPTFLDVGCGIGDVTGRVAASVSRVLGVDVNAEVVALATERSATLATAPEFRVAGLDDLGGDALGSFDVVYARCLLTHQADPEAGLAAMLAAARPGGKILVEDVEVAAVWSSPPDDALARHRRLYVDAARAIGAHPDFAAEVAPALAAVGAVDVRVDVVQPLLRTPDDLRIHACTMEAIGPPVVAQGLATADEVDGLVRMLEEFARTPGAVATLPRVVQVSARAPLG